MKLSIWAKKHAQTQFEQILFWSEQSLKTFSLPVVFPYSQLDTPVMLPLENYEFEKKER